jgi:3-dehydroquinate synthase
MKIVTVKTLNRKYNIYIKNNITENFNLYLNKDIKDIKNVIIISNERVFSIYGDKIEKTIKNDFNYSKIILKDGEEYKNLDTLKFIYSQLLKINARRNDIIISFGGGVIGDTAGLAAATFNRGINLIQYPTTIIAQVDSSIGGKVAVNFENIKNIIGCFYQPHLIICDPNLLKTLNENEIINGLGEIIKYGLVFNYDIITDILKLIKNFKNNENRLFEIIKNEKFENIIYKCIKIKSQIVEEDEFDLGKRNLLNFGHTIGHALEKVVGFKNLNHGQAVSLGILCALDLSISMGFLNKEIKNKILDIYDILKLPKFIDNCDVDEVLNALQYDKKNLSAKNKFILLKEINNPIIISEIDEKLIKNSIINIIKK